jgi:hypothetical protein
VSEGDLNPETGEDSPPCLASSELRRLAAEVGRLTRAEELTIAGWVGASVVLVAASRTAQRVIRAHVADGVERAGMHRSISAAMRGRPVHIGHCLVFGICGRSPKMMTRWPSVIPATRRTTAAVHAEWYVRG